MISKLGKKIEIIFAAALLLAAGLSAPSRAEGKTTVIRWVVAHDRGSGPFAALNERFARRIEDQTHGRLKVEFIKSGAADSQVDEAALKQVADGDADMSQLGASAAGAQIFEMPFLFRNYEHAEGVFNGLVGKKLVAGVWQASGGKVRGFGFTYSGGYRILVGRKALSALEGLKGARIRRTTYLAPFLAKLGAEPVEAGPAQRDTPIADVAAGKIDLEETEINKLALVSEQSPDVLKQFEYANLTFHRMYVTALVANEKFFARLSAADQKLVAKELESLAVSERKLSIEMAKTNREALAKKGVKFVELPAGERAAFVKAGEDFRAGLPQFAELIREIEAVKDQTKVASN